MYKTFLLFIFMLIISVTSLSVFAQWQLDNHHSLLNFSSVKKNSVAENHRFSILAGTINDQGKLAITVDLASVDTRIAIRDERMKEFVFETNKFTLAYFDAQLDKGLLKSLKIGDVNMMTVNGNIRFHGQQQEVNIEVNAIKLTENKILVSTVKPLFIKADAYGVVDGINTLKELAGLPSIDYVVPVNFTVTFIK